MRLGDLDALSAFVGDLRSTLHKEQSTFKAMTQSEFEIKDNMLLNFQYAIDNAPTVEAKTIAECIIAYGDGYETARRLYERPQGEWITFPTNHSIIQCPECTALINNLRVDVFKDKVGKMNFCPNCGAKMRTEAD